MARAHYSLKSAHLLMWSSPLLLLVLVFTLTTTTPARGPAASSRPPSSTSPVTTLVKNATTTSVISTSISTPVIVAAKTTATTSSADDRFSTTTTSTAQRTAPILNANAMSGPLSGTLEPGFEVVDVPLHGPGTWALSTSASTTQSLDCGAVSSPVTNQVVIGAAQSCQLEITSTSTEASLTWQLTPIT